VGIFASRRGPPSNRGGSLKIPGRKRETPRDKPVASAVGIGPSIYLDVAAANAAQVTIKHRHQVKSQENIREKSGLCAVESVI
jgi:hypothetical protein